MFLDAGIVVDPNLALAGHAIYIPEPLWYYLKVLGGGLITLGSLIVAFLRWGLPFLQTRFGRKMLRDAIDQGDETRVEAPRRRSSRNLDADFRDLVEQVFARMDRERRDHLQSMERIQEQHVDQQNRQWDKVERMEQAIHENSKATLQLTTAVKETADRMAESNRQVAVQLFRIENKQDFPAAGRPFYPGPAPFPP